MVIQLTPEQEQRIQAVVSAGAYSSPEEVLNAALAVVETAAAPGFAGTPEELDGLLMEGVASEELNEKEFWDSVDRETNALLANHKKSLRG